MYKVFSVPCLYMRRRAMACQSSPSLRSDLSQPEWTNQAQSFDLLNRSVSRTCRSLTFS